MYDLTFDITFLIYSKALHYVSHLCANYITYYYQQYVFCLSIL
jgi:hypothetical protein